MEIHFEYRPLAVHAPFHRSTAPQKCLFGAFGSGKTYALCAEAIALALEQPGSRILICRKTVPELRDTTEAVFFDILPPALFMAGESKRSGGHYESFTFPNGSMVLFRSIDDWNKHRSLNVCAIFYDEANEFDEETVLGMASRVRQRDLTKSAIERGYTGKITRRTTCFATNPSGHDWIYKYFVDPRTRKPGTEYFRSTSFNNPYLPKDYYERLLTYPEPWIRRYVLALGADEPVLTPTGWRRMRDLKVGDDVIGSDGKPTEVLAVHPQGVRPLYRVTTSDGGSVLADADHKWRVARLDQSKTRRSRLRWVTVPTSELRFLPKKGRRDRLPTLEPVEYSTTPDLPADPYLLGALLGDGSWNERQAGLACWRTAIPELVRAIVGDRFQQPEGRRCGWIRDPEGELRGALTDLGLMGARSNTKFVPAPYLTAAPEDRLAILQGLMDTDGCGERTANTFCTTSPQMARDVAELARSLGCRARVDPSRPPGVGGNHRKYSVRITPPEGLELFRLPSKRTFYSCNGAHRYVANVEPAGEGEALCITVAAEDRVFVTKDYILTGNCQFDDFGGQIYEEWNWDDHVVTPPLEGWDRGSAFWMALDPGTENPTAGLWVVVDRPRRRLVGIAEYEERGVAARVHADEWRRIEARHRMRVSWRVADPVIATRDRGSNMRLSDIYRRLGYNFIAGPKDHKDRIPALGQMIHLRQFVVTRDCPRTFEAVRDYKWEDLTPHQRAKGADHSERPLKKNDHLVDCAQYISSRWVQPLAIPTPQLKETPEEREARRVSAAIKHQLQNKSRTTLAAGAVV